MPYQFVAAARGHKCTLSTLDPIASYQSPVAIIATNVDRH